MERALLESGAERNYCVKVRLIIPTNRVSCQPSVKSLLYHQEHVLLVSLIIAICLVFASKFIDLYQMWIESFCRYLIMH